MTQARQLKPYDLEISVAAGRDEVWESVTQPGVLHQWFGWDYDGLAAEIKQIFVDEATLWAPEQMGWADGSFLEVVGGDDTARVRVAREGTGHGGPEVYDAIEEGWRSFLVQLRFLLDQRPRGRRRTLYLTGETTGRQALSLVPGEWERFGPRVAWTVDAEGHLVVAAGRVPLDHRAATHFEVTVSLFGADDATFESAREAWAKRWAPLAAGAELTTAVDPAPAS
ncbi:activator of HSP90 ATPase [Actinoplanes sp. TRM 88003]|uniref:Activator of HSP90 ATPase n=1 Tax=Paractinoplanes aksuensis TaxID=2939490 RepID=A0ABT1DQZ1_9ACTN|nr:activator of HSP90 ATPase [Actinoplanes aksuensis]MCO8272908.1 activator of HSP90 ATPase [Actinoplanes aksuensis]